MFKNFTYTNYLLKGEYLTINQYRPRGKSARERYYFFMIIPITVWICVAAILLIGTIPTDFCRILQAYRVNLIRNKLRNNRMENTIALQERSIADMDKEIGKLLAEKERTKADLQKLIGLIENVNNNPVFISAYLNSVIKDI